MKSTEDWKKEFPVGTKARTPFYTLYKNKIRTVNYLVI